MVPQEIWVIVSGSCVLLKLDLNTPRCSLFSVTSKQQKCMTEVGIFCPLVALHLHHFMLGWKNRI